MNIAVHSPVTPVGPVHPVPASRLLRAVLWVIPLAAVAGPLPQFGPAWMLALGGVALAALADLVWSLHQTRLPEPGLPEAVRFSKDRVGAVPVRFTHQGGEPVRLRFGLGLPAEFEASLPDAWVEFPAGATRASITWACTPRRRGRFSAGPACLEIESRWKFWHLRAKCPTRCELRVYPNLFTERKQLAALFLNRGLFGAKVQRTVGRGREFEKLREYQPGDGFDEIHWKATAKRGRPVTKIFQVERTQEVCVIIDASRLSARPVAREGGSVTTLERYLAAALVLLLATERQGDRFGLVAHSDRIRVFLRAGNGETHYGACREAVHALEPDEVTPDLAELFSFLRLRLRRRTLLFFLTDLSDPVLAEDFVRHVPLLARQHLVLVNQLRAPGMGQLFAGDPVTTTGEIYTRLGGHLQWREARELADRLRPLGVTASLLENETLAAQLVTQYLQVKRRQLL
ncbi:MAG: hypothetical protein A3G75_01920 [Verrucomicrobia bacterium RIFCSPLOWO2_12_FULL_64_8]|nr:MAG: hypothetical protein A3G75_01920 [Verrucomicrobia bacterium RIFCSPLOWO2_12_FULL_64_8]